jgi:hypothetical protein
MPAKHESSHYVILHSGVGTWVQGEVVSRDQLVVTAEQIGQGKPAQSYDALDRLTALGAIRPATDLEAKSGRGYAAGTSGLPLAAQLKFAEQDAEIDKLKRLVGDQNERLAGFAALGVKDPKAPKVVETKPEDDPALAPLLEQRAAELEQLNAAVKANEEKLKGLSAAAAVKANEEKLKGLSAAAAKQTGEVPVATAAPTHPPRGK